MSHRKRKVVGFNQFVGGVNTVAKTLTSPANSLINGVGKGLSNNNLLTKLETNRLMKFINISIQDTNEEDLTLE